MQNAGQIGWPGFLLPRGDSSLNNTHTRGHKTPIEMETPMFAICLKSIHLQRHFKDERGSRSFEPLSAPASLNMREILLNFFVAQYERNFTEFRVAQLERNPAEFFDVQYERNPAEFFVVHHERNSPEATKSSTGECGSVGIQRRHTPVYI